MTEEEEDEEEIVIMIFELIYDYINDNPTLITHPNFENNLIDELLELLLIDINKQLLEEMHDIFYDYIIISLELIYVTFIPKRQCNFSGDYLGNNSFNSDLISKKLKRINDKNMNNEQRTSEWYNIRNNMITASNAYKCFDSELSRNQLIYEKCKQTTDNYNSASMHWGVKYEPVTAEYYEYTNNTHLSYYGCIQHDKYSFIGASPDGIVTDSSNERIYGRMIEIKNIYNREITGIPKKEYWIQMQLQMEVCDLDECEYLETRFIEYLNEDEFYSDSVDDNFIFTKNYDYKGIILHFIKQTTNEKTQLTSIENIYIYKPINMNRQNYNIWVNIEKEKQEKMGNIFIKNYYWKLDEISCVVVQRNKKWFNDNIYKMKEIWDIVLKERKEGFSHRENNSNNSCKINKMFSSIVKVKGY
jgi:putative phage-type endonuclease